MTEVDANLFRLVYAAVSTEETRYYLNGVHIEAHPTQGAILVSTDGHRMIVAHDPEGICETPVIVQLPKYALALCKSAKAIRRRLEIEATLPGSATIKDVRETKHEGGEPKVDRILTVHRVIIDGTFPDWRRAVPRQEYKPEEIATTAFNPRYLKAWGDLGTDIAKTIGGSGGLQIAVSDGRSPVVIRFGNQNIFAVHMPIRSEIRGSLPSFMDQPAQLQAAE